MQSYAVSDLRALAERLECTPKGREYCTRCKVCDNHSLFINPGKKKVAVVVCNYCGVDKKLEVIEAWGLCWDDFGPEMPIDKINAIWDEVFPDAKIVVDENRIQIASAELRDKVYSLLVKESACKLLPSHREWLTSRGLPADYAISIGYASTPGDVVARTLAKKYYSIFGDDIYKVPGFVKLNNEVSLRLSHGGIFHPCRNFAGEIESLKIRKPNATKNDRLITLSSSYSDGPSAVNIVHVPLGVKELPNTDEVWVTEGERKADVVFLLKKVAVIGLPGAQNSAMAFDVLEELKAKKIVFAMDKDKGGEFGTTKLRYEHYMRDLEHREFFYADWDIGIEDVK